MYYRLYRLKAISTDPIRTSSVKEQLFATPNIVIDGLAK